ncbi:MAG: peroxiredoxin family protein [Rubrobacteraceae bacterium]
MADVSVGQKAPDFELPDQTGFPWSLTGQLMTGPVMLVFYAGDWCPYCNGQLVSFAREYEEFERRGVQVAGISVDPPEFNAEMHGKLMLPFPLLSDARGELSKLYGLWDEDEGVAKPSIVVLDQPLEIKHLYVGDDFSDRPENKVVFAALSKLDSPVGGPVSGEPKIRLLASEAASDTVRPDRPAMSLDQLFTYYQGNYSATVTLKKRLGGIILGGNRATREVERYQQMIVRYRDAFQQTIRMKS